MSPGNLYSAAGWPEGDSGKILQPEEDRLKLIHPEDIEKVRELYRTWKASRPGGGFGG
jgi:hypothetical protein